MAIWIIRRLSSGDDRTSFSCGQMMLDQWLRERATQFERRDLSRTYVAVRAAATRVLGYYAISAHRVVHDAIPAAEAKGMPRLDVPVIMLGRLAVDRTVQGQGLGALLLVDALRRSLHLSQHVGVRAVEVEALDDAARSFYSKFGFRALLDDPHHLFLPLHEIRKLKLDPLQ